MLMTRTPLSSSPSPTPPTKFCAQTTRSLTVWLSRTGQIRLMRLLSFVSFLFVVCPRHSETGFSSDMYLLHRHRQRGCLLIPSGPNNQLPQTSRHRRRHASVHRLLCRRSRKLAAGSNGRSVPFILGQGYSGRHERQSRKRLVHPKDPCKLFGHV